MRPTYSFTIGSLAAKPRASSAVRAGLLTLGLLLAACGESGKDPVGTDMNSSNADDDDEPKDTKDAGPNQCTTEGKTATCTCANGRTGTKKCTKGQYGLCTCGGNNTSDAGTKPTASKCKAGYYTGNFKGKYRPGAFGFGIFASGFEVDIEGGKSFFDDTLPPLAFTLTEELSGSGEFQTFKVGGGCMQGIATAVVITQSPFVARLEGNLNCTTGEFKGTLTGYYTLIGIPGANFSFQGPLEAQFNFDQSTLDDGEWSVEEPPAADGTPAGGGEGEWNAAYDREMGPVLAMNPCDAIGPNGEPPGVAPAPKPDASTPKPADAGTP